MNAEILEKMVGAPSVALDKTISSSESLVNQIGKQPHLKKAKEYWDNLGPGLTTGAADDDPSGIATYSQTGAAYGFHLLWLSLFTFPLMAIVQEMCARIGLVTGRGLAGNIRIFFPKWVLIICTILLFAANTLNIGADLGAMAKAIQLLLPVANYYLVLISITIISLSLIIFTSYQQYAKYLKWLSLILFSYILTTLKINDINWLQIIKFTIIPSINFSKDQIILVCGILGTTISPYLFFWQTSQEVEEQILEGKMTITSRQEITTNKEIRKMRTDVWSGMFFSNMIMFFIITACSATLNVHNITNIATASDAAMALKPFAGRQAYLLFTLGIVGTGMLAVPVLAGATAYALAESFKWKLGLYRKLGEANAFYGVIIFSMAIGLLINFVGIDSIKALIYSAVANGVIAPLILALIIIISNDSKIMGKRVNNAIMNILGWLITGVMVIAALATVYSLFYP